MTPELPALLTPESSGLLSSGFFLEKELVLANFGRDSKGDSVFLPFLDLLEIEPVSDSPLEEMVLQIPLSCRSGEGERDRE